MKTIFLLFICVINFPPVNAQSLRYSLAQPYISLSAYSQGQNDALSFTGNQAALAQTKNAGIGIHGERRFLLKETSAYIVGAAFPTRLGNFGLQLNYAGFKNFNEQKIGLAYARNAGRKAALGVQFNYYAYRIPAYGNASSINFEIGTIIYLTSRLNTGIHIYNPVGGKLGKRQDEKLASAYKLGFGYDASDDFFIGAELVKEEDKGVNVIAGLQYCFAGQFFARAGFTGGSNTAFAGAGIGWNNLRLHVSAS
ncbi:MAG TPA: hypothetical protein VK489_13690, partial [Ferruginibacter sp.]|nr:hypothetical protein [Ferruginibacter sp.]